MFSRYVSLQRAVRLLLQHHSNQFVTYTQNNRIHLHKGGINFESVTAGSRVALKGFYIFSRRASKKVLLFSGRAESDIQKV